MLASVVILIVFSNTFLYKFFCHKWEIHTHSIENTNHYEVGLVLTGMAEYNSDLKEISIRRGGDRIWQAINLYKAGKIDKIMISGASGYVSDRGLNEAEQFKSTLLKWGFPEKDILIESKSRNTHENAVESKNILEMTMPHIDEVLLITSGRHMRRASACLTKVGLKHECFSTDLYTGIDNYIFWDEYIVPEPSTISDWRDLIKEYVGYFMYKIMGYL